MSMSSEGLFRMYGTSELMATGYPQQWVLIARAVKTAAGWCCENCGAANDSQAGHRLGVHHLNGVKADCRRENLVALCQSCYLRLESSGACAPNFPREQGRLF